MCIDTGMLALVAVSEVTTASTVRALCQVAWRYAVDFMLIHSDGHSTLKSPELRNALRRAGHLSCEVTVTPKGASEQNPVERLHREVWSVIRCRKFGAKLKLAMESGGEVNGQILLDEISSIVNSRPIGYDPDAPPGAGVITPAMLAFGRSSGSEKTISVRLIELRRFFYEACFDALRRRFNSRSPRNHLYVGQRVLLREASGYRGDFPVKVGKIISVDGPRISALEGGRTRVVGSYQVVPLAPVFQSPRGPESPPGGACGDQTGGSGNTREEMREQEEMQGRSEEHSSEKED
jgi:hypothetical protein